MNFKKNLPSYFIAFSLFSLSMAIVFFSLEIRSLRRVLNPELNKSVTGKELVVSEILSEFREVRKLLPNVLEQVEKTRNIIPTVLKEFKETRMALPEIHKSIDNVRLSVNKVTKGLPNISKEISKIVQMEHNIPKYLDRVEDIMDKGKNLGKESSRGVLSGFVTGLLTLPFDLVSGFIPENDIKLTRTDNRLLKEATLKLLVAEQIKIVEYWENPTSKNSGSIQLVKIKKEERCRSLKVKISQKKTMKFLKDIDVCQDEKGQWKLKE